MTDLLPLFLNLTGRAVVLVGGGPVATAKLRQLLAAGARVRVVAPNVTDEIRRQPVDTGRVTIIQRAFVPADLDGAWLVVAAATPEVNRHVADVAETLRVFVNAVDDPANASAFLSGVVRRDGVTLAISTSGVAPGLTALLREGLDALLPGDLGTWMRQARAARVAWRREGVPMDARKPRLLEALNALYPEKTRETAEPAGKHIVAVAGAGTERTGGRVAPKGHVSLVGSGPGDPGLLTRTAIARLRAADFVLYDALVDDRILRYARRAQRFYVGKRAGHQAMTQTAIQALMIRAAHRGRRVVRLKGGDPFVFGRGGEEALALQHAGIPYDVVPGISSAIAAPASAGIPVTHRGVAAAFLVVSGHEDEAFASAIGQLQPNGVTVVVLMGRGRSAAIARRLIDRGWAHDTPAAMIVDASRPQQQVWRGTIEQLATDAVVVDAGGAGTIVIGDVVAIGLQELGSENLEWAMRTRIPQSRF